MPRIPEVRDRLDLSLGALGTVLLGVGVGGLVSSAASGVLVDRVGSKRACVAAAVLLAAGLPLIGLAPSALALALVLVALGVVDALADIGMNVQAAQVDARTQRSAIQGFHAWWSIGTLVGAAASTAAAAAGVALSAQLAVTGAVLVGLIVATAPALSDVDDPATPTTPSVTPRRRRGTLALLAGLALVVAVLEGAPGEWSAVFGADVLGASEGIAGLGYLAVSAGMVLGRLAGDRATDRLGPSRLFRAALATSAAGATIVCVAPAVAVAVAGFAVIGVGNSVLFPALYLTAARSPGVPAGVGLGVMTTGARIGFLASPLSVGWLADATSLRVGLGAVLAAAVVSAGLLAAALSRAGR